MEAAIPNFTVNQIDSELRLREHGVADGQKDMPSPSETHLSQIETQVIDRVDGALNQETSSLFGVTSTQDFVALPRDLEILAEEPDTILKQFRAKKARAQSAIGIELANAHQNFARSYRDYRAFRMAHGLTHTEPSYDNIFWRKVFWLALLFVIEVAANGWVIGQASPGGLVQGWTTALMISVMVVLTGTLVGVGPWRYLNYRGENGKGYAHRLWAIPAVLIGGAALLLFAFYVAHYRFALSHSSLDAPVPENILTSILTTPFAPFQQLESLVLFIIALLIGVFAVARGAHWDEPYPGYGRRHRSMEDARERAKEIALGLSGEIDTAKRDSDEALDAIAAKSQDSVAALRQAIKRAHDYGAVWDSRVAEIIGTGRDAIELYRDANRATRGVREPSYFNDDPFVGHMPPASATFIDGLESALASSTKSITRCKSELAGKRGHLEAEYHSFYDDEIAPFLKGISDAAMLSAQNEFNDAPSSPPQARTAQTQPDDSSDVVKLKGRSR